MAENVTNELLFEQLRAIQAEQAASRSRDAEVLKRLSGIETALARLGREQAQAFEDQVQDRHIIDKIRDRLDRIERRLDLVDAPDSRSN